MPQCIDENGKPYSLECFTTPCECPKVEPVYTKPVLISPLPLEEKPINSTPKGRPIRIDADGNIIDRLTGGRIMPYNGTANYNNTDPRIYVNGAMPNGGRILPNLTPITPTTASGNLTDQLKAFYAANKTLVLVALAAGAYYVSKKK